MKLTFSLSKSTDLYLLLGNYLTAKKLINFSAAHFASIRREAESMAWDKSNIKEVDLPHIYKELSFLLHLSKEQSDQIMALEALLQKMLLKPFGDNPSEAGKTPIKGGKKKSLKIYGKFEETLESTFLQNNTNFLQQFETECFKVNQHFFDTAASYKKIDIWEISLSRFEKILSELSLETGGLTSALAGASKQQRLSNYNVHTDQKDLIDLAAGMISPIIAGYCLWILKRAQDMGINKLFFFACNGSLIFKVAEILSAKLQLGVESHLIPGSKMSGSLASAEHSYELLPSEKDDLTVTSFLSHFLLEPSEIEQALTNAGFSSEQWKRTLSGLEKTKLLSVIKEYKSTNSIIDHEIQEAGEIIVAHILKTKLSQKESYAFVNIFDNEMLPNIISGLMENKGYQSPFSFYFSLNKNKLNKKILREGYLYDGSKNIGYKNLLQKQDRLVNLIFLTEEDEKDENLRTVDHEKPEKKRLTESIVTGFAETLFLEKPFVNPYFDFRLAISRLIKAFGRNPQSKEAHALNTLHGEIRPSANGKASLVSPYKLKDLVPIVKKRGLPSNTYTWAEGSLAVTPKPLRISITYLIKVLNKMNKIKWG